MLSKTFEERLKWLDKNHYELCSDNIVVEEKKEGGEAKITFDLSNDVIKMNLGEKNRISYLRQQKVADAVLFELLKPQGIKLHIVECKATVKEKEWHTIKAQFEGALLNALAVMGIFGLSVIHDVVFYTAYRNEYLSAKKSVSPSLEKTGVGPQPIQSVPIDWKNDRISILSIKSARHQKIPLDNNREARLTLNKN